MTEDKITDRCLQIFRKMGSDARQAALLYSRYSTARFDKTREGLPSNSNELVQYCRTHPNIRQDILEARKKVRSLLQEDASDPAVKNSEAKQEIRRLKKQLLKEQSKNGQNKVFAFLGRFFQYLTLAGFGGAALILIIGFICYLVSTETGDSFADNFGVRYFWLCLIAGGVSMFLAGIEGDTTFDLQLQISKLENEEQELDNTRRLSALNGERMYSNLLALLDGANISDITL